MRTAARTAPSIFNDKGEFDTENVFEGNTLPMNDSEGNMLQGKLWN